MSVLGQLGLIIPLGLAGALSTVPIAVVLVILLSHRAQPNGLAYLVGWGAGVFLATFAVTVGLTHLPPSTRSLDSPLIGAAEIVVGLLLAGSSVWRSRRPPRVRPSQGAWLGRVNTAPVWSALVIGIALGFRPKALLLATAVGLVVSSAGDRVPESFALVLTYSLIVISSVALPVVLNILDRDRTTVWLTAARAWLARHGAVITLITGLVVGVAIAGNGLTRF